MPSIRSLLLFVLSLSLLAPGCALRGPAPVSQPPVVGVILPYSSAFTPIAREQEQAIRLALEGMVEPPRVVFADGGADAEGAQRAFEELLGEDPVAVISCASWAATALHRPAAERGIFHLVIGSAAFDRSLPGHTVRFTLDARAEEGQLAAYLGRFERLAVFHMDNGYGRGWAENIGEQFAERIVVSLGYDPLAEDFTDGLAQIAEARPDALLLLSAGNAGRIARQARALGIEAQLVGTRPIERPELLEALPATEGLVYTYPSCDSRHPLFDRYEQAYGAAATNFAAEAWDAMQSLARALHESDASPAGLFGWYAGREWQGALGEVDFSAEGDAVYPYLYKQIEDGRFRVAAFQFPLLLEDTREQLHHVFHEMHESIEAAAEKLSLSGIEGPVAQAALEELHRDNAHSYDCVTVSPEGIIVAVAPEEYADEVVGADISDQEQIQRLHATHEPVVSQAIDTVEGFVGFDLEHPVFNTQGEFIGSVSILTEPDFFGQVIRPRLANFPVEMWIMQPDGRIVYDDNEEEIGLNLFTDPLYQDYEALRALGREMVERPEGEGRYRFIDKKLRRSVDKRLLWTTVSLHGTEFRLALAWVPDEL